MSRLEEIKEHFRWTLNNSLVPRLHDSEIEWLIEQAERVQELEEENVILKATRAGNEEHIDVLHKQIKRYREALEWYSENSPHGNIADEALEGEKHD